MRKFIVLLLLLGIAAYSAWHYGIKDYQRFLGQNVHLPETKIFHIAPGSGASKVVDDLVKEGILQNPRYMLYLLESKGYSRRLQPGNFQLEGEMTPEELCEALTMSGKYEARTFSLDAGMHIFAIAERLHHSKIADKETILSLATNPAFAAQLGVPAPSLEGYLGVGVYTFNANISPESVLTQMHERFRKHWLGVVESHPGEMERFRKQGFGDHELLTLASMVEREAVKEGEKPVIARVFYNRLQKKMPLQSDPTCIYPPLHSGEKPSPQRCKDASNAYSTYVIAALPPGPIANVKVSSMQAVLKPYEGPEARALLYFVAKNDGSLTHYFSKTYKEHQQGVNYFLKKKGQRPRQTTQPTW